MRIGFESQLLAHRDFPIDDLRRELGLTEPMFETVIDPSGAGGELEEGTVLAVAMSARTTGRCCGCATGRTWSMRASPVGSPDTT